MCRYLMSDNRPSKPYLGLVAAASGCLDDIIGKEKGLPNGDGLVNGMEGVEL